MKRARYISLGAGTQSTAVFLMWLEGDIEADFAVFADTGWEPAEVYGHLWRLAEMGAAAGRTIYVVHDGNIRDRHLGGEALVSMPLFLNDGRPMYRPGAPAAHGKLFRSCTDRHKVRPINRFLKRHVAGGSWDDVEITRIMGISFDEIERMRPAGERWSRVEYPLVDRRMTRHDCIRFCRERGVDPPRSACIGCPLHSPSEWRRIRDEHPDEFADAVDFDRALRSPEFRATRAGSTLRSPVYLHRSGLPLDTPGLLDNEEDRGQGTLFGCDSGFCGT